MKDKCLAIVAAIVLSLFQPLFAQGGRGWNDVHVSFNSSKFSGVMGDLAEYGKAFSGASVGYDHFFPVFRQLPVFVSAGGAIQYSLQHIDYGEGESDKTSLFSLKVPVSAVYKFALPGGKWTIEPLAALGLRLNVFGKYKESDGDWSEKFDIFNKDEGLSGDGDPCKRLQPYWHIGVNMGFRNLYAGVTYGTDLSDFYCDEYRTKFKTLSINLGLRF